MKVSINAIEYNSLSLYAKTAKEIFIYDYRRLESFPRINTVGGGAGINGRFKSYPYCNYMLVEKRVTLKNLEYPYSDGLIFASVFKMIMF